MPVVNRIADFAPDMEGWRRHLHAHPELSFDCEQTARFVVEQLKSFGVDEIHEGIAKTGVVAVIRGQGESARRVGLRADMDALPIEEETGAPHASTVPGKMHACGHDGHTTMLLGAARYLAETRNFAGEVVLLFQPAEEQGGGGEVMVQEGVMDRFGVSEVYALHNAPMETEGHILTAPGPVMAGVGEFEVTVHAAGGHAAYPHQAQDPLPPALAMIQAVDSVTARNHDPAKALVLGVTQMSTASNANNVIGTWVRFSGTIRYYEKDVADLAISRLREIVSGTAAAFGVTADISFEMGYPPTINHAEQAQFAVNVAREVVGDGAVVADAPPVMGAEDFSYMLEARPGAYLMLGQGDTAMCHQAAYDFNDAISPVGASFFARLVERAQPVGG